MFSYLGCLFALLFGVVFIIFAFVGSIIDVVLRFLGLKKGGNTFSGFGQQGGARQQSGFGGQRSGFSQQQSGYGQQQSTSQNDGRDQHRESRGQQTHKIFEKDDSEYVDFEEV